MSRIHQWYSVQMLSPAGRNLMIPGGQRGGKKNLKRCDCVPCCLGDFLYGLMDIKQTSLLIPVVSGRKNLLKTNVL